MYKMLIQKKGVCFLVMNEIEEKVDPFYAYNKLLIYEPCLLISPTLATISDIGLNGAIVLQQIHYWMCVNYEREAINSKAPHMHLDRVWAYNSIRDWRNNNFPFWSISTVTRIFDKLIKNHYILVTTEFKFPGVHPADRTKWYSLNYDYLLYRLGEKDYYFRMFSQDTIRQILPRHDDRRKKYIDD